MMRSRSGLATLVLNSDYQPITVVSTRRALILFFADKVEILEQDEEIRFHSAHESIASPVVVRLIRYVKIPYRSTVGLSRRALMHRDNGQCQYCKSNQDLTVEHVVPKSRGGLTVWENVCIACRRCNHLKGDKTLAELGWKTPVLRAPTGRVFGIIGYRTPDPRWSQWLNI